MTTRRIPKDHDESSGHAALLHDNHGSHCLRGSGNRSRNGDFGYAGRPSCADGGLFVVLEAVEFFLPMRAFGSAFHVAMNGLSAGKRLLAFFEIEDPSWGNEMPQGASMALKDVTFAYEEGQNVLDGVSMTFFGDDDRHRRRIRKRQIDPGQVASWEKRADRGEATIDGKDIQACSREGWLGKIGVVSYDSYIFHESIRDNFRMAKKRNRR